MTCQTCLRARRRFARMMCRADPTGKLCRAATAFLEALEKKNAN